MAFKPTLEFFNRKDDPKPENLPLIIGSCFKCDRGENTLVIVKRERSINHRERDNDKFVIKCFCCRTSFRTDLYQLIENSKKEEN